MRLAGQRLTAFKIPLGYLLTLSGGSWRELVLLSQGDRAWRRGRGLHFLPAQNLACKLLSVTLNVVFSTDHLDALLRYLKEQSLAHQKFVWVLNISRNGYKKLSLNRCAIMLGDN